MNGIVDHPKRSEMLQKIASDRRSGGSGPTGGGGDNGMTARVDRLEKSIEKIDGKLDRLLQTTVNVEIRLASIDVKLDSKSSIVDVTRAEGKLATLESKVDGKAVQADLSELKGKIDKFVDKWFVLKTCLWSIGAVTAFVSAVSLFQDKIRVFLGVH